MREAYKSICPICEKRVMSDDMMLTHDCHGIPFRYVCPECWYKVYDVRGFDGEYYTELDENYDYDY